MRIAITILLFFFVFVNSLYAKDYNMLNKKICEILQVPVYPIPTIETVKQKTEENIGDISTEQTKRVSDRDYLRVIRSCGKCGGYIIDVEI